MAKSATQNRSTIESTQKTKPKMGNKGKQKQSEIISAARELLIEQGIDKFSMRKLAAQLDTQLAHLQYYFPKKEALLAEIYKFQTRESTQDIKAVIDGASTKKGKLLALIDKLIEKTKQPEYAVWFTLMLQSVHNSTANAILEEAYNQYVLNISDVLGLIVPQLSQQRRQHIARLILAMIDGASFQIGYRKTITADKRGLEKEISAAALSLIDM